MKNEQSNKQRYHDAFDQIKLSEEGYRQIRNREENTMIPFHKKTKKRLGFQTAACLAALTLVFLSANGIAYAATGSTLVEQMEKHISIYINGKPYDGAKVTTHEDENGDTFYTVSLEEKKNQSTTIVMDEIDDESATVVMNETGDKSDISIETNPASSTPETKTKDNASVSYTALKTSIKQIEDSVYLSIEGLTKKPFMVDITENFADGCAEGTVQIKNVDYQYKVTGTVEEYTIDFEKADKTVTK